MNAELHYSGFVSVLLNYASDDDACISIQDNTVILLLNSIALPFFPTLPRLQINLANVIFLHFPRINNSLIPP